MKKYELTDETIEYCGKILYRIKALISFDDVEVGETGGWVESESNLSQEGNAWIFNNAKVYDNAQVRDNAWVFNNTRIYGNALICDNARVYDNARVGGNAKVCGNAWISDTLGYMTIV